MKTLLSNPVLNKEIKLRLRSFKSYLGILLYLLVLGGIALSFVYITISMGHSNYLRPEESRMMFIFLSSIQLILIIFVTPGLTGGVISGERERQTLNMLLATTQSSAAIITGKLLASIAYLLLMMIASIPLYSIVFLFGGVSPLTFVATFGIYVITILGIGSLGIMFSTLIRRTIVAMITTYGTALFLMVGTGILTLIFMSIREINGGSAVSIIPYITSVFNPAVAFMSILEPEIEETLTNRTGDMIPLWLSFFATYAGITLFAVIISMKRLRPKRSV